MTATAQLGRSGAAFSRLGLGTWAIGGPWRFGWGPVDDDESIAAIRRAVDEGINWIDTAAVYGLGHSEEIVGRALTGRATGDDAVRVHEVRPQDAAGRHSLRRPAPRVDPRRMRGEPASPGRRADRPLPDPLAEPRRRHAARGLVVDDGPAGRRGQGPLDRGVELRRRAAGALRGDSPRRLRAAAAVDGPAANAARRDPVGRGPRDRGDRLLADGLGAAERDVRSRPAGEPALRRHAPGPTRSSPSRGCRGTSRSSSACARSPTSSAARSPSSRSRGPSRRTE